MVKRIATDVRILGGYPDSFELENKILLLLTQGYEFQGNLTAVGNAGRVIAILIKYEEN